MNATDKAARGTLARRPILIGDHIELMGNMDCLREAAEMFDWQAEFFQHDDHSSDLRMLSRSGLQIIALENTHDAHDLFRFTPPRDGFAVIVGNERKGVSRQALRLADRVVQIPIGSTRVNTLNVAAAAAVAMYSMSHGRVASGRSRGRPEVMLAGVADPIELGSAVRSAACFGWTRVHIDDRHAVWFETDRVTRSLGRGAARRGRNPIHAVPAAADAAFDEVLVIHSRGDGEPLRRADLARGSRQLVIIVDEHHELDDARLVRLGTHIRRVSLGIERGQRHPFRLVASIALAEIARQLSG
jgi:tRNA(Leu) C34 or U34 (ribose-2'-O)-methylase TrmL